MDIGILIMIPCVVVYLLGFGKTRNLAIGYRTRRSLASDENWRFAQHAAFSGVVLIMGTLMLLWHMSIVSQVLYNTLCWVGLLFLVVVIECLLNWKMKRC